MLLGFILGLLVGVIIGLLAILLYIVESVKKIEKEEKILQEIN